MRRAAWLRVVAAGTTTLIVMTLAEPASAQIQAPAGIETFEGMSLGQTVHGFSGWSMVPNGPGMTVTAVDTPPAPPVGGLARWLRILDTDAVGADGRFYSSNVVQSGVRSYTWHFLVNSQTTPPGGASAKPRYTIQHDGDLGAPIAFANAWGIEFTSTGLNLVVTGIGGVTDSVAIPGISFPADVGNWMTLSITADFDSDTVSGAVNSGTSVSLPINLVGDESIFRFCYRGEGTGNVSDMLLDNVSVLTEQSVVPGATTWAVVATTGLVVTGATVGLRRRRTIATV